MLLENTVHGFQTNSELGNLKPAWMELVHATDPGPVRLRCTSHFLNTIEKELIVPGPKPRGLESRVHSQQAIKRRQAFSSYCLSLCKEPGNMTGGVGGGGYSPNAN